ncbi:uncharacterized protein LOC143354142 isoform X2 [Halictus rubicundus]|uniref:uncharacterized protein LOC143354142 isoform X2 n=1 Tax=Halictus rubicundus TaxID=77578 RepID=UPI004037233B
MKTLSVNNHDFTGPKNLSDSTADQLRTFLNSFDVVLSDCDGGCLMLLFGVLSILDKPIPGAMESLKRLQDLGKRVYVVSNNGTKYFDRYKQNAQAAGLDLKPEQVVLPSTVVGWYLKKINFSGEAFVVASKPFRKVLTDCGIKMSPDDWPPIFDDDLNKSLESASNISAVNAVIFDFDIRCSLSKLAYVIQCLKNKDVLFLAGSQSEWIVVNHRRRTLAAGALIKLISHYSGRTPIGCGKPGDVMKDYLLEVCQVDPERCLFIGDSITTDMTFASKCGFQKLFVETGLDTIETASRDNLTRPDYYISNLGLLSKIVDSRCESSTELRIDQL